MPTAGKVGETFGISGMVVLDGTVNSKALACLVFSNFLLVLAQGNHSPDRSNLSSIGNRQKSGLIPDGEKEGEGEGILKINQQKTVFLPGKKVRTFRYLDAENHRHNLSITVTPCSSASIIKWSFSYRTLDELKKQNSTNFAAAAAAILENDETDGNTYEIASMKTVTIENAKTGWYLFGFCSLGPDDASVSVYITMDDGGPYELGIPQDSGMVLTPQRRQRLKVTWQQSLVNPQNTSYCLVVNTKKEYPSLCGAEEEGPVIKGLEMPVIVNLRNLKLEKKKKAKNRKIERGMKHNNDTVVVCVDRKMQLTFSKLKKGVKYYFDLFAINNKTNLTIPYGKSFIRYNFVVKPINLRDGIRKSVDLRKLEGKALFRYKVNDSTKELHFYVLACGGAVDVKVKATGTGSRRGRKVKEMTGDRLPKQTRVFGYKRFKILYPVKGEQYYLKVNAPNVDELTRIKYVEVLMTLHPAEKYPLPVLPEDPNLYEFKSQRRCDSVTIGWLPVRDDFVNTYCVTVWENRKFNYADLFRGHYQCDLDDPPPGKNSLATSPSDFYVSSECEDMITVNKKSVTNYRIRDLKPGKSYTIQVTVKKKKNGRTLSYKFLRAFTKHSCN